jgi:hypothetical protein
MKRTFQIDKANLELVETLGQMYTPDGSVKNAVASPRFGAFLSGTSSFTPLSFLKLETQRELHDTRVRR